MVGASDWVADPLGRWRDQAVTKGPFASRDIAVAYAAQEVVALRQSCLPVSLFCMGIAAMLMDTAPELQLYMRTVFCQGNMGVRLFKTTC